MSIKLFELFSIDFSAVFAITFAVAYLIVRAARANQKYLPCIYHLPIVGSLPFLADLDQLPMFFLEKTKSLGSVYALYLGSRYTVVLNGRQAIHDALVKQSLEFADRPSFYNQELSNPRNKGILELQFNDSFKKFHQLSLSILKQFGFGKGVMENRISFEVGELISEIRKSGGRPINPDVMITHCVLNVIASIIFGKRYDSDDPNLEHTINYVTRFIYESMEIIPVNFFPPLRFLPSFRKKIDKHVKCHVEVLNLIERKITESLSGGAQYESFVNSFVEAEGPGYDHEQLLFILRDLLMAGTETSSTTLKWALLLLANHKDVQRRLRDEIDSVVSRDRLPSLEDRAQLPFVEATILEIWRNKTIVPMALPHMTMCDTTVDGCFVPSGTTIFVNLYSAHNDPDVWKDPAEFRPDRFIDEQGLVIGKDLIMPFSVGRRSCLGELLARQEVFLFLSGIVQNFELCPPEGCDVISCTNVASITVAPSAYDIRLIPRSRSDD